MTFCRVNLLCDQQHLDKPNIQVCSDRSSDFTITRAQLSATFQADTNRGAYIVSREHDSKCLALLERSKNSDVVLFPEYCFSYDCIEQIVEKKQYWPLHYKLWCLPCQGISYSEFLDKLNQFERSGAVVLRDGLTPLTEHRNFVNVLMYCFITTKSSESNDAIKFVLLPQLKTQPCADRRDKCETYMTTGDKIFVFGEYGGNCLISLLCADVLNPELSWSQLKNQGKNLIILHPQLNPKPIQTDFQKLRQEIFQGPDRHVYISANWAKGTSEIQNPWSCVYFKHEGDNNFSKWRLTHEGLLKTNPRHLLYGGFYNHERVSIWYAWTSELAQQIKIQKPHCSMAVLRGDYDVTALQGMQWDSEKGWQDLPPDAEQKYRGLHYKECLGIDPSRYIELLEEFCNDPSHKYPFLCADKSDADRFWELFQAKKDYVHTQLDQNEIPHSPVILFVDHNMEDMKTALRNMRKLRSALQIHGFPKHLRAYDSGYRFEMSIGTNELSNVVSSDGLSRMILAIAEDDFKAERFIHDMKNGALKEHREKDSQFPHLICVLAEDTLTGNPQFYPEFDPSITASVRERPSGIITEGGRE